MTTRQQIWQLTQDVELIQRAKSKIKTDPGHPEYWEAVKRRVEELLKPRKKPKASVRLSEAMYQRYREAKWADNSLRFPMWCKDGHFIEPDNPDVGSSNGLTEFIVNFLLWSGHHAVRTGNEGRVIMKGEKAIRIKSSSGKGLQDIDTNIKHPSHPFGIPWKIEIKIGKDTQSTPQEKFEGRVKRTGGKYSIIKTAEQFMQEYDSLFQQKSLF